MLGRTRIHTRARGSGAGAGSTTTTDLQRILALSPSLLVWPALATMTVATNGTGAAPTSGQAVGRILDLSPNGNNLIAGTWASPSDAARGTFQNNAISFDGSSDYYSLLNAISITTNMTVVRAFKRASAGIVSAGLGAAAASAPFDPLWLADNNTYSALGAASSTFNTGNTSTGSFVTSALRNASNQIVRRNGSQLASITAPAVSGSFDAFGRRSGNYNSGEISFLAVFPTDLTGADLTLVEQIAAGTNGAVLS